MPITKVAYYQGKPVDELSKEELIEALEWVVNEIEHLYESNKRERNFWADLHAIETRKRLRFLDWLGNTLKW